MEAPRERVGATSIAPWPERRRVSSTRWGLIPDGHRLRRHCKIPINGSHNYLGWEPGRPGKTRVGRSYCHFYSSPFVEAFGQQKYVNCLRPLHIFERPDVRLVLDLGGGTAWLARALHELLPPAKLVVITSNSWHETTMDVPEAKGPERFVLWPHPQFVASHGFPTVSFDHYSFFPFSESTFDVIHSAWSLADRLPERTIFEIHRVLRPGGFLVLNLPNLETHRGLDMLFAYAKLLGWRLHGTGPGCESAGAPYLAWQTPLLAAAA